MSSRSNTPKTTTARATRLAARGFTLIELLIAMVAGLLVALAALILSRNATRFFQHEARISGAQISAMLGINRISSDLQRASFLSTPNITTDPKVCGSTAGGVSNIRGLELAKGGSVVAHGVELTQSVQNGFNPDSAIIGGAFDTTEQFPVRACVGAGAAMDIHLQVDSGAMSRTLAAQNAGAANLNEIFRPGRFLRMLDAEGRTEWGVISAVTPTGPINAPTDVTITTAAVPAMQGKQIGTSSCGYVGYCIGYLVNPVSRVLYDIRSLAADPTYAVQVAPLSANQAGVTGDTGRTELVRVELKNDGTEVAATREIVAEFAVDLKFGISAVKYATATPDTNPTGFTRFSITMPETNSVYTTAPERVRSVQLRLSTRSRAPDRDADIPMGAFGVKDGRRFRMRVNAAATEQAYARLRTLNADVDLPNQAGITW
jgi:prepilin-type N-terminal cleavage/methylation domain-containing protein